MDGYGMGRNVFKVDVSGLQNVVSRYFIHYRTLYLYFTRLCGKKKKKLKTTILLRKQTLNLKRTKKKNQFFIVFVL